MTRKRRETSSEEQALFQETFADIRPVLHRKTSTGKTAAKSSAARMEEKTTSRRIASADTGLDGRTAERLRRGQLDPQSRLDLHGMTEAAAHRALVRFIKASHAKNMRLVLVVTGKGSKPADDQPFDLELDHRSRGVLKTLAPRWLREPELAPLIADLRAAHRRHGGGGALYIYLRKASQ